MAAFVLFPAVIAFSLYSLDQQGFFQIDNVEIKVQTTESQKNFVAPRLQKLQAKLDSVKGISLWKAPLSQISKSLREEKWIKNFQLSRSWPSTIKLVIEPDTVTLLVLSSASGSETSALLPITKSGRVLERISSDDAPNAIVSYDESLVKNERVREGAINVIKALPEKGRMSSTQISEIGYDKKEGYWIKLLQSETKVNLGEEQFEIKSVRIAQVMEYLESRNLKARVIDANLSKKVLVRLQQNP
ncbi:cell division protein [Pseudobdellovibrio exovorus JSS]|uniref:Cell division protein n=2 Tax=Pseudobdellovibrio exovorus TaxID=453816 RepID=M4VCL5_9BACT|nr:cell division protein [Pseudobdellovibrio exovorus JSS]